MNTYQTALQQYENEDENGKHRLIYAYFGLAIYYAQVLEETFSIMIWTNRIFKKKVQTNGELREIINAVENSKKTMGIFIQEVKTSYTLTDIITNDLNIILNQRNYIVHKYFKLEIQKCYSELGRKEMLRYLGGFIDKAEKMNSKLKVYYEKYTDKLGLTKEKIENIKNEMIQEELNRAEKYKH